MTIIEVVGNAARLDMQGIGFERRVDTGTPLDTLPTMADQHEMDPRRHTILSINGEPRLVELEEERAVIERHVGRYIVHWTRVDYTLGMSLAAWANPSQPGRMHEAMNALTTSNKINVLKSLLPDEWRDGQSMIRHLAEGNKYRNLLAHSNLAMSGFLDGQQYGWNFWQGKLKLKIEYDAAHFDVQQLKVEVLAEGAHFLMSSPYLGADVGTLNSQSLATSIVDAPGTWATLEARASFVKMACRMFPGVA